MGRLAHQERIDLFDDPPWTSSDLSDRLESGEPRFTMALGSGLEFAFIALAVTALALLFTAFYWVPWALNRLFDGVRFFG
jgi:hypothetical protein